MKRMKRFVSLMLVVAMLASSCVFAASVSAEGETSSVEVTAADMLIVEKLEAFGAITNEYEDIGAYVSRRQMADIITTYVRMPKSSNDVATTPFVDVPLTDGSVGNITALYNAGIITGDENLRFHPEDYLTYDEAIVFVVNAVGHKYFAVREGGYPTGYHRIALKNGMLDGLKFNSGKELIPLCDVYKMLESAMGVGAVVLEAFTNGTEDYRISVTETFLSDTYNIVEYRGIVTGTEFTNLDSPVTNMTDEQVEIDGVVYDTPGYVYATSLGRAVYYYIRETVDGEFDVAYVEENEKINNVKTVNSRDLIKDKTTATRIFYNDENNKERHINLANNVDVIYNGKCYSGYGKIANVLPSFGYIEALDNTGDEVAEVLFVYEYNDIVVGSVDTYEETIKAKYTGEKIAIDSREDIVDIRLMPEGSKMKLAAIKPLDVVSVMESKGTPKMYTFYVSRDTVSGTVEEISSERGYLIDGEYYELAPGCYVGDEIAVGMTALFYLDFNGKIVYSDRSKADIQDRADESYAVVAGIDYNKKSATPEIVVKLFTGEGSFLDITVNNTVNIDGKRYNATGSDIDTVLQILSEGTTDENGVYTVNTAYVVKYAVSDGKLSYIDTGKTGVKGKLRPFAHARVSDADTKTFFLARSGNIMQVTSMEPDPENGTEVQTVRYASFVPNQVYFFSVPNDGELDKTEEYSVSRTVKINRFFRGFETTSQYTDYVSGFMMYDLGENDTNTVDAIMIKGGGTSTQISGASAMYAVTKVTNVINAEGTAASKLYLNASSSAVTTEKITEITGLVSATNVSSADLGNYIKPGMVISYGTDENNLVDRIKVLAIYNEETGELTVSEMSDSSNLVNTQDGRARVAGEVIYVDPDHNIINIKPKDKKATNALLSGNSSMITVYRRNIEKKATAGTISSIAEGDLVLVRLESYFNAIDVIVFKK